MNLDLIRSTAETVRFWAEGRAAMQYGRGRLGWEEDLNGWCAIASAELWRQLSSLGFKPELHAWICPQDNESTHVFLVVEDHVVDITATQFSKMRNIPVYIEHVKEAARWNHYQTQSVFASPTELIRWQKKGRWPSDQIAWNK